MKALRSHRLILTKAILFVAIGAISAALLVAESPRISTVLLLAVCVWSFARAYYFAFYVIERYVDPSFRFSGVMSAVVYLCRRSGNRESKENDEG